MEGRQRSWTKRTRKCRQSEACTELYAERLVCLSRRGKICSGLGALASYDSTWITHHDDFSDLLAQLNAKKGRKEEDKEGEDEQVHRESIEMRSKCTKARIQ